MNLKFLCVFFENIVTNSNHFVYFNVFFLVADVPKPNLVFSSVGCFGTSLGEEGGRVGIGLKFTPPTNATEAPKPDLPVSATGSQKARMAPRSEEDIFKRSLFKPTVNAEENKEHRSSDDRRRRHKNREAVVTNKRALAERTRLEAAEAAAAAEAAHAREQEAAEDENLINRIDEIVEEFSDFEGPQTESDDDNL